MNVAPQSSRQVLISAGEASGDLYGAALLAEIKVLAPSVDCAALGGTLVSKAGARMIGDSSQWGAVSIVQSIRTFPRIVRTYFKLKRHIQRSNPGVFVPIDFGYVNIRLCRAAKSAGWKILYLIPPGSWRKDRQGKDVAALADIIVTNFPWSETILRTMGANVFFFGHPLKQILKAAPAAESRSGIAVLLGSRRSEIEQLISIVQPSLPLGAVAQLPVPAAHEAWVRARWNRKQDQLNAPSEGSTVHNALSALRQSEFGVICSGTATLEAALVGLPMVVVYKVSKLVEFEAKLVGFKKPKYVSQPNILLDREVVPELIQAELTPASLQAAIATLSQPEVQQRQRDGFAEISELLGGETAVTQTAIKVLSLFDPSTN